MLFSEKVSKWKALKAGMAKLQKSPWSWDFEEILLETPLEFDPKAMRNRGRLNLLSREAFLADLSGFKPYLRQFNLNLSVRMTTKRLFKDKIVEMATSTNHFFPFAPSRIWKLFRKSKLFRRSILRYCLSKH